LLLSRKTYLEDSFRFSMTKSVVLPSLALAVATVLLASFIVTVGTQKVAAQSDEQQGTGDQDREMRKQRIIDRVRDALEDRGVLRVGAIGILGSFQNDAESGEPSWVVSGSWRILIEPSEGNKTAPTVQFRSLVYMVMFDGSAKHTHRISDFSITDWSVEDDADGNSAVITFNGTATVTLRDGPMEDVPVSIKLMKAGAVSIWIDSEVVNHFGDTPIYGVVVKSRLPFGQPSA
jgi:hypothetical protein